MAVGHLNSSFRKWLLGKTKACKGIWGLAEQLSGVDNLENSMPMPAVLHSYPNIKPAFSTTTCLELNLILWTCNATKTVLWNLLYLILQYNSVPTTTLMPLFIWSFYFYVIYLFIFTLHLYLLFCWNTMMPNIAIQ